MLSHNHGQAVGDSKRRSIKVRDCRFCEAAQAAVATVNFKIIVNRLDYIYNPTKPYALRA